MAPADIVEAVTAVGPARARRRRLPDRHQVEDRARAPPADQKYVVCNADEGDSGTFSDRMVMEGDPLVLIEGMTIAGDRRRAPTRGYIYLRSEYPHALRALERGDRRGLRARLPRRDGRWDRRARSISRCGSAPAPTSAAKRPRCSRASRASAGWCAFKPPLPAIAGLFGQPTVINNVISFASVPIILDRGAEYYRDFGMGRSRGTLPIQLAGNIKHGGLVEKAFGVTLRELLYDYGGGSRSGRPDPRGAGGRAARRVHSRVAVRHCRSTTRPSRPRTRMVGHGGIVVFDDTVDMAAHGALRDGVLRHRVVRQVHALPHRFRRAASK